LGQEVVLFDIQLRHFLAHFFHYIQLIQNIKILRRILVLIVLGLYTIGSIAQEGLNTYKYVVIPKRFDAFNGANKHQTSTVLKYLFTQKGFQAVYSDALPRDLVANTCLGLSADILDESNLFTTKVVVSLMDCEGKIVFSTAQGKSKEKEYKTAYAEALRNAMASFDRIKYVYTPKDSIQDPITIRFNNDVKKIEDKTPNLKKAKNVDPLVTQRATETEQLYKNREPVASNIKKAPEEKVNKLNIKKPNPDDIWYAQPKGNGYQLVDSSPKVRMKLAKSSVADVYFAVAGDKNGIAFKKDGIWYFEYYEGDTLVQETLQLKF
jgi:hypothetical protein